MAKEKSEGMLSNDFFKDIYTQKNNVVWNELPEYGRSAEIVGEIIKNKAMLDYNPALNTSSYVQVQFEPKELEVIQNAIRINLADQTIYPHAFNIHNEVVSMVARMWHCPEKDTDIKKANESDWCNQHCSHAHTKQVDSEALVMFNGAGTVGSTEGCLLAGIALKFRWRKWYAQKHHLSAEQVLAVRPNMVISSCFQAAWEKFFRYFDVEPRIITPSVKTMTLDASKINDYVDDQTIGVVGILGNHWAGQFDEIAAIDAAVEQINATKQFQLGIHVDAASGGFIAPFIKSMDAWDFRLKNVLSISTSGHKYGEACAGTGWVIWRHRENLSEYVAVDVSYLGGHGDSYTLNFSRPSSGAFSQYYKLLRFGRAGYQAACENALANAALLRAALQEMTYASKPRFEILDSGDKHALPVVAARLNPDCDFNYDDIDLQHALAVEHWYVSGYAMSTIHPISEEVIPLFHDESMDATMFRVVIKAHITKPMINDLIAAFKSALEYLDSEVVNKDVRALQRKRHRKIYKHC